MSKSYNIEQVEAQSWCLKHNHIIYAVPVTRTTYKIVIRLNNREPKTGTVIYQASPSKNDPKWWERIAELYVYYKNNPPR